MSYEGYYQYLCTTGHESMLDVHDTPECDEDWKCPDCKAPMAWQNSVDLTNGSFLEDEDGTQVRIDGYVELEVKDGPETCKCLCCGDVHIIEAGTYHVPKEEGQHVAASP